MKWGYNRAFLRCALLFLAGTTCQLLFGPLNNSFLHYPWGLIILLNYLYFLILVHANKDKWSWINRLSDHYATVSSLASLLCLTIFFGLIRQESSAKGLWTILGFRQMTSAWSFNFILLYFTTALGLNLIDDIANFRMRRKSALLSHLALFALATIGMFGSGDKERVMVTARRGEAVMSGICGGAPYGLPFTITLNDFDLELYESENGEDTAKPKKYLSDITVVGFDGLKKDFEVTVNHPAKIGAWRIYQVSYDKSKGSDSEYSVLECVKDPWYPAACIALWVMLIAGTVMFFTARRKTDGKTKINSKGLLTVFAVASAFFVFVKFLTPSILSSTPVPALQSNWFVPHVAVYMISYTLLGIVTLYGLFIWIKSKDGEPSDSEMRLCDILVRMGWGFMTLGIIMGALWAKQAWGDYWSWDPKETWAAATWLSYLLYLHIRGKRDKNISLAILVFSFILLQMCWYGVNYLPSAQAASVHIY